MEVAQSFGGLIFGFWFYKKLSHPFQFRNKLPNIRFMIIEILPSLRLKLKNYIIHLHHWILLSGVLTTLMMTTSGLTQLILIKSFCLGGIIQGLSYHDRFKIIFKSKIRSS
ncbi:hypothetical protein A3A48_04245 [Candidatus Curtissbacteria bacterium RIFCSPLOWO2_01_FULL_37_9]|nr:MAG: hypothetical protein A3A48_04245 [Candidatus Curtissbacteria bacterium RIFCSPLOWO2_01_FULL_37_9]